MLVIDAISEILKKEGIKYLSAFPTTSVIEAAAESGIKPIICRQERVGVGIADGYSRITGGNPPGVFAMQYGPGAENAYIQVSPLRMLMRCLCYFYLLDTGEIATEYSHISIRWTVSHQLQNM